MRPEELGENVRDAGGGLCRNTRRHLPDRWILFRGKKLVHLDRAWVSDAAQIVTHHVGDHQVFSAVLDGRRQPMPLGLILYRVGFSGSSAFHRLRVKGVAVQRKETLRRGRNDRMAIALQVGTEGCTRRDFGKQLPWVIEHPVESSCMVDLIYVTGLDALAYSVNG